MARMTPKQDISVNDNHDYLQDNQFLFKFETSDGNSLDYRVVSANIPDVMNNTCSVMNYKNEQVRLPGNALEYADLQVTFMASKSLKEYFYFLRWIRTFSNLPKHDRDLLPPNFGTQAYQIDPAGTNRIDMIGNTQDITLHILDNNNNPKYKIVFHKAFPTIVNGLNFNAQTTQPQPIQFTVGFDYQYFDFE